MQNHFKEKFTPENSSGLQGTLLAQVMCVFTERSTGPPKVSSQRARQGPQSVAVPICVHTENKKKNHQMRI